MPLMPGSENAWIVLKKAIKYVKRFSIILMNNKVLPPDLQFPRHATGQLSHPELRHNYNTTVCHVFIPLPCLPSPQSSCYPF